MSILLLLALIASFFTLATAIVLFNDGKARQAWTILSYWSIGAASYGVVLIAVAALPHTSAFKMGEPYCDDDVCMGVEAIHRTPALLRLDIKLSSRANRGPRSAKGALVYLMDRRGRRFAPLYDRSAIPFDVVLEPGASAKTSLSFEVPADAEGLSFAAGMEHVQYASFIIGIGDLLHRPRVQFPISQ